MASNPANDAQSFVTRSELQALLDDLSAQVNVGFQTHTAAIESVTSAVEALHVLMGGAHEVSYPRLNPNGQIVRVDRFTRPNGVTA